MRARPMIAGLLCGAVVLTVPMPAGADDRSGGSGGAYVNPDGNPTAVAGDGSSISRPSGGGTGTSACEWQVVIPDDVAFAVYDVDYTRQYSMTGRWLQYWCPGTGAVAVNGNFVIPEGGLVDPRQLAVNALASVDIGQPSIATSPSTNGRLFVQLPTWLWLDQAWWRPSEATAHAGDVWSTVRATPVETTWSLGDGHIVSCRGPGIEWRPGMREGASGCTHIYRRSSADRPGGKFRLQATVTFAVTWSSNAAAGGTLPAITRTSSLNVDVGEIQAIGTRGGS